jgi:hypothetical protein
MNPVRLFCVFLAAGHIFTPVAQASDAALTQGQTQTSTNPAAIVTLDQLGATRERPLFVPDRRRPAEAPVVSRAAPPPPPPAAPPQVSLFGVLVDADGPRAVIRSGPTGKMVPVRLGDNVGGWRVTLIEGQRLVISLDDRSVAVTMFENHTSGKQVAKVHPMDRVLEVNAAGVLRSHRIHGIHR